MVSRGTTMTMEYVNGFARREGLRKQGTKAKTAAVGEYKWDAKGER
jgi:hypothetical protein